MATDRILLSPRILGELTSVSAWVETVNGRVSSAWRKEGNQIIYEFSVPYNVLAEIRIEGKILNIRGLCETDGSTENLLFCPRRKDRDNGGGGRMIEVELLPDKVRRYLNDDFETLDLNRYYRLDDPQDRPNGVRLRIPEEMENTAGSLSL